ncbi:MAG TPA: transposase [Candidatus Hydrogenedentes bacterium]|nr:transposase [Candidatus Hydrogenedentota bacterium]
MQAARRHDLTAGFAGHPLRPCVRRAAALRLQTGLEDAVTRILGRGHSERADGAVPGDRNGDSHPTLKTEAGVLHLRPPTVRDTAMPVSIALPDERQRMTPELGALIRRDYVCGLSTRDGAEVFGGRGSKSTASRTTPALQAEGDAWRTRDLGDRTILSLFRDGPFQAARAASSEQEGILGAYALGEDGKVVRLHLGLGPRERTDAWGAVRHDLSARHLTTPLLVITDGNPGLVRAVTPVVPGIRRQRGQGHTLRTILATLPKRAATQLTPLLPQVFLAPDPATGLRRGRALLARFRRRYPAAMACLEQDLDACLTSLLCRREHQQRLRTTNLLERTFAESRRRTKVIPRFPGARRRLSLVYATRITASRPWRGTPMRAKILRALGTLRAVTPTIVQALAVAYHCALRLADRRDLCPTGHRPGQVDDPCGSRPVDARQRGGRAAGGPGRESDSQLAPRLEQQPLLGEPVQDAQVPPRVPGPVRLPPGRAELPARLLPLV